MASTGFYTVVHKRCGRYYLLFDHSGQVRGAWCSRLADPAEWPHEVMPIGRIFIPQEPTRQ
eukprot:10229326-Heterocapsa_arctica.AAC.1